MDVLKDIGLWVMIVTLIIIAIHPTLQRLGIMRDKWKEDVQLHTNEIHQLLTDKNNTQNFETLPDIKRTVESIMEAHKPRGEKYKSDLVCECNLQNQTPCFKEILEVLKNCEKTLDTVRREQKMDAERTITINNGLIKVLDALLKRLGE